MSSSSNVPSQVTQYTTFALLEVLAVEATITQPGAGATKLQTVLNSLQNASQVGILAGPTQTIQQYSALVSGIVAALNSSGVFTHTVSATAIVGS